MKDACVIGREGDVYMGDSRLKDIERLQALARTGLMDGPGPGAHQRAARIAARLLDVPVSLVSFVDDARQYFSAHVGLEGDVARESGTALSHSLCQYVVKTHEPLIVTDARQDPRVCDNGAVRDMGVVAYLGVPIRSPDGHVLGSFCVIDRKPRDWHEDDVAHMVDMAAMIESDLRLRETLEERDIILQEMSHRVKNLFTIINSMLRMERSAHDTATALAESMGARLKALSDAHEMIVPVVNASRSTGVTTTLDALMRKLLAPHGAENETRISISGEPVPIGAKAAVYLTLALHELATNAAKYGGLSTDGGRLSISWLRTKDDTIEVSWEETGVDWDADATPRSGFGARLLSIAVEGQLAGEIKTQIDAGRFQRKLHIPLQRLQS
ncbi:sensor histidine kinase [Antarctobacter sp.]|uniref:sensor histidine kinase n=1 Tax=Antarctobacter sp. TaxID=1872577 RepID=UPI002B279EBF|nr:GAF domain-containing protein [Antarctobacter sp.]